MGGAAGAGRGRGRAERGVVVQGIVYVLSNPAMPGLVKIGMTSRDQLDDRVRELSNTSVPAPFVVELWAWVEDARACERLLHGWLSGVRMNSRREFFFVPVAAVFKMLRSDWAITLWGILGVYNWYSPSPGVHDV